MIPQRPSTKSNSHSAVERLGRPRVAAAVAVLVCMALTAWAWSLTRSLPAAQAWGERQAWAEASERLAQMRAEANEDASPTLADVEAWREKNRDAFDRAVRDAAGRYKDRFSYQGADGRAHVYLGDLDSYYWLHFARKLLRSGRLCDAAAAGRCLDDAGHAPVGAPLAYPHSLHVFALAAVHRLITGFLSNDFPLPASASLVPVIVAVLGVLPAFFLGRMLGGNLGGMFAAVTVTLHPVFLQRSLGGDNDVWNLVLPLYLVWAAAAALSAARLRRTIFAILAGAVAALHATIWQGWVFTYAIVIAGLLAYLAIGAVDTIRADRSLRLWRSPAVRAGAETLFVFYVAAGLLNALAGVGEDYVTIPLQAVEAVTGALSEPAPAPVVEALAWPDVLGTVRELQRPTLWIIAISLGGGVFMLVGLVGLLIAYFPGGDWRARHYVVLFCGIALYTLALAHPTIHPAVGLVVVALPPFAAAAMSVLENRRPSPAQGLAMIVLLWFLGALYLSYDGLRYVFFLAPAFGLALAAGVGRFHEWLRVLCDAWLGRYRTVGASISLLLLAMILVLPASAGIKVARAYVPVIDDGWWDSLTALRERSDPRSIVTVWWDYGHWAKYVADRRVTMDGASLLTHLPHWVAKALTTPDPVESLGVLRMLDCASEASPLPEGSRGAYGRIKASGRDDLAAYSMATALTLRTRAQAAAYLAERGFADEARRDILAASHCDPPEAYLVLSTRMLRTIGSLFSVGRADPRRPVLTARLRTMPEDDAQAWLATEFGYSPAEAKALYDEVQAGHGQAPRAFVDAAWRPCQRREQDGALECRFGYFSIDGPKSGLFRYRRGDPPEAVLAFDRATSEAASERNGAPGLLLVAGEARLESVEFDAAAYPLMAVLVDPENARVVIGSPTVLRSMLVHLLLLDGRYTGYFRKIDERGSESGETVSVWRIDWAQASAGQQGFARSAE